MKSFYAVAAAAFAGLAFAQNSTVALTTSTVYTTQEITVTSCASTIKNCPAESTIITTVTVAAYTTICPVTASQAAASSTVAAAASSTAAPAPVPTVSVSTTITYSPCPPSTTLTPKMITRSAASTTPCSGSAASFTSVATGSPIVPVSSGASQPTITPAINGAQKVAGGLGGAAVIIAAALML